MTHVLVVEDEEHIAAGLRFNLEAEGYTVDVEENGQRALDRLTSSPSAFQLVLLDVMLPDLSGFDVVRALRRAGQFVPVMMLTARGEAEDVSRGFDAGADEYLPKPFDLSVLLARMRGLLRRKEWLERGLQRGDPVPDEFEFSGRRIDFVRQLVERNGQEQPLTLMETTLLRYLVEREGRPVSRKTLLEDVWGVRKDTDTRTVDNFIARLRRHIEDDPSKPQHLQTIRGVGYCFVREPAQAV